MTTRRTRPTGRNADPRRTIPLNSSAWRKLRERVLARDSVCEMCWERGHVTIASDIDHIDGNPSNNGMGNLQALCHSCHSRKTRREMNGSPQSWGCDADGQPTDPDHPWNQKSREAERERPHPQCSFNPKSENEP